MRSKTNYWLLCAISGVLWGIIAAALAIAAGGALQWGWLIASSSIGLLVGLFVGAIARPWIRAPFPVIIYGSLFDLYLAAALYGFASAIGYWCLGKGVAGETFGSALGSASESAFAAMIFITRSLSVIVLWPLAFANHQLLARWAFARQAV